MTSLATAVPDYPQLLCPDTKRSMNPYPVGGETLRELAASLDRGETRFVRLEPGDTQSYALVIVPAWTPGVKGLIEPPYHRDYLMVAHKLRVTLTFESSDAAGYTLVDPRAEWDGEFLSWWLKRLWAEISAVRGA